MEKSETDFTSETSSDESHASLNSKKTFACTYEGCTASFSKNSKLTYHIRRHTGERPFVCTEPGCNKTYLYSFHLRRHKDLHHGNHIAERVCCTVEGCYLELANKYSLKKHIKLKHNSERNYPFNCAECQQGFHRKRQLLHHSYVHTGILPFKCEVCNMGFATTRDCNRHKRTHTNYSCKCGKTFERWSHILTHKKTCEENKPTCNICKRKFTQLGNLKEHLNLHMKRNVESYICGYDNCARSYSYKKNLSYHINKYHKKIDLPRIACTEPTCKITFTRKQTLQNHIKKFHSKETDQDIKKAARKSRKDKGTLKTNMAALLAGLELPQNLDCGIKGGQESKQDVCSLSDVTSNQIKTKENIL